MKRKNYTPEEIAAQHDRNENFHGKQANLAKIRLYHELKNDLTTFMRQCDYVKAVDGFDPNPREKHAVLWLDFKFAAMLDKDETTALTIIMNKADGTVLSGTDGHVRISFWVNDIWLD